MFLFTHLIMTVCTVIIIRMAMPFKEPGFGPALFFRKKNWRSFLQKRPTYAMQIEEIEAAYQIIFLTYIPNSTSMNKKGIQKCSCSHPWSTAVEMT